MKTIASFRLSRRRNVFIFLTLLNFWVSTHPFAHSEESADLDALLADAKSEEPAKRLAAYEALRLASPGARTRLAALLDSRLRSTLVNFVRLLGLPAVKAEAAKRTAALDALRQTALTLIFD